MKRKINSILTSAFELGASDIHLTVGVPPVMRINGMLKQYGKGNNHSRTNRKNGKSDYSLPIYGRCIWIKGKWIFHMVCQVYRDFG